MMLQIEKVKPAGVKDRSYLSERFPTVLTKMSLEPERKILNSGPSLQRCKNLALRYKIICRIFGLDCYKYRLLIIK